MKKEIEEKLREIKSSFRIRMNGLASKTLRENGMNYKLNWGISLPDLRTMAQNYEPNLELAIALWKEDIRECKIMATLLAPHDDFPMELAELWLEQTDNQEIAESLAFNLLQHLDYASELSFKWLPSDNLFAKIAAYNTLGRLFSQHYILDNRDINEYIDQALVALVDDNIGMRRAAFNSLQKFSLLGEEYEMVVKKALKSVQMDF